MHHQPPASASSSSGSDPDSSADDARPKAPTRRRTKHATPAPRVLSITLTIGDWLGACERSRRLHGTDGRIDSLAVESDVLDYVGVWNVAQVLSIPSSNSVRRTGTRKLRRQ